MAKLFFGVGFSDANYKTSRYELIGEKMVKVWVCPFYAKWANMFNRCYSQKFKKRNPAYEGCSVCDEWLTFSNFKKWMESQDWKGKELDKDLLFKGNKIYSPETCVFISDKLNNFITDASGKKNGDVIGVYWNKRDGKFVAQCSNPFTGVRNSLGYYDSKEEAYAAWRKRKHELACQLSVMQENTRVAAALRVMYLPA